MYQIKLQVQKDICPRSIVANITWPKPLIQIKYQSMFEHVFFLLVTIFDQRKVEIKIDWPVEIANKSKCIFRVADAAILPYFAVREEFKIFSILTLC